MREKPQQTRHESVLCLNGTMRREMAFIYGDTKLW